MYPPGNDSVVKIHDLKIEFEKLKVQRQRELDDVQNLKLQGHRNPNTKVVRMQHSMYQDKTQQFSFCNSKISNQIKDNEKGDGLSETVKNQNSQFEKDSTLYDVLSYGKDSQGNPQQAQYR